MAYDLGPKIGIEGEAEFRNQIKQINTTLKTLGTEMQMVTSAFIGQEKSMEALRAKNEVLSKSAAALENELELQKKMLEEAVAAFGEADERTLKWQQTVNHTTTELNKTNAQIVENEREMADLVRGLQDADSQWTETSESVRKNSEELDDNGRTVEDTADKHDGAMAKIASVTKAAMAVTAAALAAATTAVIAFAKSSLDVGMQFDSTMSQVSAISGATGDDLDELRDKALEMGASTQFSASQAGEAFTYMAMAGWKTEDMLSGIEGIMHLAAASGEDLATTSDIVTDALTAFGLSAADSGHFADILAAAASNANTNVSMMGETFKYAAPIAGALGYTAEDTALAIGLMANSGIKASQAGTALRTILSNMSGTLSIAENGIEKTTIATTNSDDTMRSFRDVLVDLRSEFATLTPAEQAWNAENIVGKNAMSGFLALMNASQEDFDKLAGAVDNCTYSVGDFSGAAEEMAATMVDNLGGDITLFQSALESAQIALSDQITPALREFVQFGSDGITQLTQAFQEGGLSGAMDALGGIISEALSQIIEQFPLAIDAGMQLLGAVAEGLMGNLPVLMDGVTEIVKDLVSGLLAALPDIVNVAIEIISTLVSGLTDQLPELIPVAVDTIIQLATSLTDPGTLTNLIGAALDIILALSGGLIKAIPTLLNAVPTIVKNIVEAFYLAAPDLFAAALELIAQLGIGLVAAIPQLLVSVAQIPIAIIGGIMEVNEKIVDVGKNIVEGLWNGISSMASWLHDHVSGFFTGIINSVKGLLGIHSPSRVFAGIGENMAAGLGKGWDDAYDDIAQDIQRGLNFTPTINPTVDMAGITMSRPNTDLSQLMEGMVNGIQTATAGNGDSVPTSAVIVLPAADGTVLARWMLPDLRAAMRDDPVAT